MKNLLIATLALTASFNSVANVTKPEQVLKTYKVNLTDSQFGTNIKNANEDMLFGKIEVKRDTVEMTMALKLKCNTRPCFADVPRLVSVANLDIVSRENSFCGDKIVAAPRGLLGAMQQLEIVDYSNATCEMLFPHIAKATYTTGIVVPNSVYVQSFLALDIEKPVRKTEFQIDARKSKIDKNLTFSVGSGAKVVGGSISDLGETLKLTLHIAPNCPVNRPCIQVAYPPQVIELPIVWSKNNGIDCEVVFVAEEDKRPVDGMLKELTLKINVCSGKSKAQYKTEFVSRLDAKVIKTNSMFVLN